MDRGSTSCIPTYTLCIHFSAAAGARDCRSMPTYNYLDWSNRCNRTRLRDYRSSLSSKRFRGPGILRSLPSLKSEINIKSDNENQINNLTWLSEIKRQNRTSDIKIDIKPGIKQDMKLDIKSDKKIDKKSDKKSNTSRNRTKRSDKKSRSKRVGQKNRTKNRTRKSGQKCRPKRSD